MTAASAQVDDITAKVQGLVNTGAKLFSENQLEPARLHFLAALSIEPYNFTALQNLGATLRNLGHYSAAEVVAKRSVMVTKRENPYCLSNLGVAQLGAKKYQDSLKTLAEVLKGIPESAPSWHNYGLVLYMTGQYEKALEAFTTSLKFNYDVHAASDRALSLMSMGRLAEGLAEYESRWLTLHKNRIWGMNIAEWQGEDLEGRHILLHHEQGFGDSLMLIRFIKHVAQMKCQITLAVPAPLVRLFTKNFPFVKVVDLDLAELTNSGFDYHSPLLSVMRWIGISKPEAITNEPYLQAEAKSPMTLPQAKFRIGICWASGNHSPVLVDRRRLVPINLFLPLLGNNLDIGLVSLQKGADTKDLVTNGLEGIIFDISAKLDDFADTANAIQCLDLVISVDSAVAHLAGALGKRCIMLSPYTRCWRWWGKSTGWPWYNKMKVYHQSADGTWNNAMNEAVAKALWIARDMK